MDLNELVIIGNLTRDPEARTVNGENGEVTVCNFSVAVNRYARAKKITDFFRVSCWGKQAENAVKYLSKGRKVAVRGAVTARAYTGNDGGSRCSLEVFADTIEYLSPAGESSAPEAAEDGFTEVTDDELPF